MGALAGRNLKVFFRDTGSVVMSMFAVLVVIGLYALFLGDQLASAFSMTDEDTAREIVNSWVIAGIIGVSSMTSSLGALGVMVEDRVQGIERDFLASPLRRSAIAGGYAISTYAVGCVLSIATFILGEAYIVLGGGEALDATQTMQMLGGIMLAAASSGSIVFFVASFLRTSGAYSAVSMVVGVAIGFITGCYIPIGSISEEVAMAVKLFPVSHSTSYFRMIMTDKPLADALAGAPSGLLEEFQEELGVFYVIGGQQTTMGSAVLVMVLTTVVFFGLTCLHFGMKKKSL